MRGARLADLTLVSFLFDRTGLTRPPGAGDEEHVVGSCIRCARCVEVCPYQAIRLAPITALRAYGTPFINPGATPCYLCMRCPTVCPTTTLSEVEASDAAMGRARVVRETCYSWTGTVCNQCYRNCPLAETAIELDDLLQPVVLDGCVGCGVCLHVCPTEPRSIEITPRGRGSE